MRPSVFGTVLDSVFYSSLGPKKNLVVNFLKIFFLLELVCTYDKRYAKIRVISTLRPETSKQSVIQSCCNWL